MRKRHALFLTVGLPLLWQSATVLVPSVISVILQLLNLGGGGLNFIQLLAIVAGVVTATGLDLGLGITGLVLPPAVFVFVL
ncbi:MAG: hypothetical protein N0A16_08725 [Blastocatellia bacterium]|nr:hypothetical protein [Blastocatellia bacterium]MCS7157798.1 hypothetical protein [Blastocatellia bacterium]MCX7753311.1 hypothetical protein [Blastocatellia bacterium]MDW8168127.1 hypothetical protein [Acidobacteriota bacterium]MDW8257626.1 hypothetical protein [Acidobacteriota bacterium]